MLSFELKMPILFDRKQIQTLENALKKIPQVDRQRVVFHLSSRNRQTRRNLHRYPSSETSHTGYDKFSSLRR